MSKFKALVLLTAFSATCAFAECEDIKQNYEQKNAEFESIRKEMSVQGIEKAKYDELKVKYDKTWKEASQLKKDLAECELSKTQKHLKSFNEGLKLKKEGKLAEALVKFEATIKEKPDYENAYVEASGVLIDLNKNDNFDNYIAKVNDKEIKGKLLYKKGLKTKGSNPKQAIKYLGDAALCYKADKAYYQMGVIYAEKLFDGSSAIAQFKKAIAENDQEPQYYEALGAAIIDTKTNDASAKAKNVSEAIKSFEKGVSLNKESDKEFYLLCYRLAQAYNMQGNAKGALEYANKAIEKAPNKSWGPANLEKGIALKKAGNTAEAKAALNIAKKDLATQKQAEFELSQIK